MAGSETNTSERHNMQATAEHRKLHGPPYAQREMIDFLDERHIPWRKWGEGTDRSLADFLEDLNQNQVTLIDEEGRPLTLVVNVAVSFVQYVTPSDGTILELFEDRQVVRKTGEKLRRGLRGLGETMRVREHEWFTARRGLHEELKFPPNLTSFLKPIVPYGEDVGPVPSEKYRGFQAIYKRRLFGGIIPKELYIEEGYVEPLPDRDIYFVWKPI